MLWMASPECTFYVQMTERYVVVVSPGSFGSLSHLDNAMEGVPLFEKGSPRSTDASQSGRRSADSEPGRNDAVYRGMLRTGLLRYTFVATLSPVCSEGSISS